MQDVDALIVGAGASGLMCAIRAGRRGRRVAVLDKGGKTARKVRIAGGGRCNFTNLDCEARHYLGENPHFCKSALARFSPYDILSLLAENGLGYEEKAEGQLFCEQGGAAVAGVLERLAGEAGASVRLGMDVQTVEREGDGFVVRTDQGDMRAPAVVVATGGRSWPGVGATTFGYEVAKHFGLRVVPPRPALTPLVVPNWRYSDLSGVALPARVTCGDASFADDVLFTHKGLSGPAILQISSYWRKGEALSIDLLPGQSIVDTVEQARHERGKTLLRNVLGAHFPERLARRVAGADGDTQVADLRRKAMDRLAEAVHAWTVQPSRAEGWDKAEVTAGGVDTAALSSKTMAARSVPGLYFTGEVVDVTGWLGGYNLHWAWASGFAAGEAV
ncbi:BaiN/RdsA family NAD(P)/FAD-dependent oxidoreductase [Desulfobaculum sp.]